MSIYSFQVNSIQGKSVGLSDFHGKVLLIVNTASQCGYARQFAGLQELYAKYREKGFEILAFPCNQFNGKEPGSNPEIQEICTRELGVTFPVFEKIDVRGISAHPLFQYLVQQAPFRGFDLRTESGQWMESFLLEKYPDIYAGDGIKWNFTKFLIDRDGTVKGRYETPIEPSDLELEIQLLI